MDATPVPGSCCGFTSSSRGVVRFAALDERVTIADRRAAGLGIRAIAQRAAGDVPGPASDADVSRDDLSSASTRRMTLRSKRHRSVRSGPDACDASVAGAAISGQPSSSSRTVDHSRPAEAGDQEVTTVTGVPVCFCQPGSPWQPAVLRRSHEFTVVGVAAAGTPRGVRSRCGLGTRRGLDGGRANRHRCHAACPARTPVRWRECRLSGADVAIRTGPTTCRTVRDLAGGYG
ncbi:hypothetical protein H4W33_008542 [Kibdelosporangium phytohabitans]|nr:hypothetical protein [Kibdelosporangium phytohabitans]